MNTIDEVDRLKLALRKIDAIRNSIVACQSVNWSAHIYPLVEALESAGYRGMDYKDAEAKFAPTWEQSQPAEGRPVAQTSPSEAIASELAALDLVGRDG